MDIVTSKTKEVYTYFKSTVISLGSSYSGNPVAKIYDIKDHVASAGPGFLWKVYNATRKTTREKASVFILEKNLIRNSNGHDKELILDLFRKGVFQLTRLRHPSILTIQHPLEECKDTLAFVTEPVLASLGNVLNIRTNMPSPLPESISNYQFTEIETKYGLLQITEGLMFLHNNVKLLHRNLCPENIIVNVHGSWKLFGFDYALNAINPEDPLPKYPFIEIEIFVPYLMYPNLNYLAPEYLFLKSCCSLSDMFALGLVLYTIYNKGYSLLNTKNVVQSWKNSIARFRNLPDSLFDKFHLEAQKLFKVLLCFNPTDRLDAFQLEKHSYFKDIGVQTMLYLDRIYQWDDIQKSQYYKDLVNIIPQLPKGILLQKLLPCLVKEYYSPDMVPFILPSLLLVIESSTPGEFVKIILPDLTQVLKLKTPYQIRLILMKNVNILIDKCPSDVVKIHIFPLVYASLETPYQEVEELALKTIPFVIPYVDYPVIRNALLPRIKKLCLQTSFLSTRVNSLVCIGNILEHLDKWIVIEDILPFIPMIPSREPSVIMSILGIVKLTLTHKKLGVTTEIMASKLIPCIMPLILENELNVRQFDIIMGIVKDMISQVEKDQRAKLERINIMRKDQVKSVEGLVVSCPPTPGAAVENKGDYDTNLFDLNHETKDEIMPKTSGNPFKSPALTNPHVIPEKIIESLGRDLKNHMKEKCENKRKTPADDIKDLLG